VSLKVAKEQVEAVENQQVYFGHGLNSSMVQRVTEASNNSVELTNENSEEIARNV